MVDTKTYNIFRKKRFWAGILLAQILLFYLLSQYPIIVRFFQKVFSLQAGFRQGLLSKIPFSVGDIIYAASFMLCIAAIARLVFKIKRNRTALHLLWYTNAAVLLYYLFWGMLYFATPVGHQLPNPKLQNTFNKILAEKYLKNCIEDRKLVTEDKNGVFKIPALVPIEEDIRRHQAALHEFFPFSMTARLCIKPSLFSNILGYTGILGYYNPFTAEAQYDADMPSPDLPFTLAHEMAHQTGIAREDEANFAAWLLGKDSRNVALKYSADYFALRSILNALAASDEAFVKGVLTRYSAGMQRDRRYQLVYRHRHEGWGDKLLGFTNDIFLRGNRQDGSISYTYFVDLLRRYEYRQQ